MMEPVDGDQKQTLLSEKVKEEAESLKIAANRLFHDQEYEKAVEKYTEAIKLNPYSAVFYGNRSYAYLKLELYGQALEDANKAIELDVSYKKAFYRRATAYMALGKFEQAQKDFNSINIEWMMSDAEASEKYAECCQLVQRMRFEQAIAVESGDKRIADTIDLSKIEVEEKYKGPRLGDDGSISVQFMNQLLEHFKKEKILHRKYALQIILKAGEYFKDLPTLVDIEIKEATKFTVCGDIHGQFYDLLRIFELNGKPSATNPYLFNGDFVDRGSFSVECIMTLFGYKILYPDHFYMARGNHETLVMNQMFGFDAEVREKYDEQMTSLFTEVFNLIPLCHCINKKVLVIHGGLFSKEKVTLEELRKLDRVRQPPDDGLMSELLWSDPQPRIGRAPSKRGIGIQFGPDVTRRFLNHNKLDYIIRSHEVKERGYEEGHDGKCITVFSAPNYCDTMGNKGAFIVLRGGELRPKFITFNASPHPARPPLQFVNPLITFFS